MSHTRLTVTALCVGATALTLAAVDPAAAQHDPAATKRAHAVMGFDQAKTTHRFSLYDDGGAIEVSVNDPGDVANRDAIRSHLPHIAQMFQTGNFEAPMLVHAQNVPGTAVLAKRHDRVSFTYHETARGGRVDIVTTDREALTAVHAFLKFQIADHKTGDASDVRKRPKSSVP